MTNKCVICGKTFAGKPHKAPPGVILCSYECYLKWKFTIIGFAQLCKAVGYRPLSERLKQAERNLQATAQWIRKEEEVTLRFYIH